MRGYFALGAISYPKLWVSPVALHFFNLLPGGHSSLEPRLPIPNRTVKRVCANDSVPFAHAKVGYRQTICKQKSPASKEDRAFLFLLDAFSLTDVNPASRRAC
jgi:hypothetical protein